MTWSHCSVSRYFKESRFYVSFLLIATFFFLFTVNADLVYLDAIDMGNSKHKRIGLNVVSISYVVSFLCDGVIYIMLDRNVRKRFNRTLEVDAENVRYESETASARDT